MSYYGRKSNPLVNPFLLMQAKRIMTSAEYEEYKVWGGYRTCHFPFLGISDRRRSHPLKVEY